MKNSLSQSQNGLTKEQRLREMREARFTKSGGGMEGHAERQATDGLHSAGREKPQRSRDSGSAAIGQVGAKVQTGTQSPKVASAGIKPGPSEQKPKRGRTKAGDTRAKPWEAAGMSKATYYRRQAEERGK